MSSSASGVAPTGEVPEYVPPHLRGKVWDFRNEPGGAVSFYHPEAAMGLAPDQSRARLGEEKYKQTFDRAHRLSNFTDSMEGQYAPLERLNKTPARRMNEGIADKLRGALDWGTSTQGKAVGTAGLLSALGGGLASFLWDYRKGQPAKPGRILLTALLAGGAGAGGTALGQARHNAREKHLSKNASMEVATALIRILEGDPTLSRYDRARVLSALSEAPDRDKNELYRLLRTSVGAGAGMIAMRFLGAKGLLPMLAGGILGGMVGSRGPGLDRNAQGQLSITNYF